MKYSCFTLLPITVRGNDFQAVPDPEARVVRTKIMRHSSFPGPGGQVVLPPGAWPHPCRGARRGALQARPCFRNRAEHSAIKAIPADAFGARRPCLRTTNPPLPGERITKMKDARLAAFLTLFPSSPTLELGLKIRRMRNRYGTQPI